MADRTSLRHAAAVLAVIVFTLALLTGGSEANHLSTKLDRLRNRLATARDKVASIQNDAESVSDQIASIDRQRAAVLDKLAVSRALIGRLEADIAELQREISKKTDLVRRTGALERELAVELYKSGGFADLQVMLDSDSVADVQHVFELSDVVSAHRVQVMVKAERAREHLESDQAELEVKLTEAREVKAEQETDAQQLKELRLAKQASLSKLRKQIRETRNEAEALSDRSDEIEEQLAAEAARARARREARREARQQAAADAAEAADAVQVSPPDTSLAQPTGGFIWPINGPVTSGFGMRWGRMHEGIDIDCTTGDPIHASRSGRVLISGYDDGGYGYHVVLSHSDGFGTLYGHASRLYVSAGAHVTQGQTIAACGSTGYSTGDHLHFEIRVNGVPQDPLNYLP